MESWQISQPLYLRHLAIVRDTLLRGKSHVHVHYTYENFKKLVEDGTGFWEAVKTVPDELKTGNNTAASLDAEPDIDEYGFPKLDEDQFLGPSNDATLAECVSALNAGVYRPIRDDPYMEKQADGTFGKLIELKLPDQDSLINVVLRYGNLDSLITGRSEKQQPKQTAVHDGQSKKTSHSRAPRPVEDLEPPLKFTFLTRQVESAIRSAPLEPTRRRTHTRKPGKSLGRPRKYPKSGIPTNIHDMNPKEIKRLRDSQEMAEKYERQKIEYEIETRAERGEDVVLVTNEVLAAADTVRNWEKMEPLPNLTRAQILHKFAGGPTPEAMDGANGDLWSQLPPSYFLPKRGRAKRTPYWPSMAAHTLFVPTPGKRRGSQQLDGASDVQPMNTRHQRQRRPVAQKKTSKNGDVSPYFPSLAAHTCPVTQDKYLPSIAAHSGSFFQLSASSTSKPISKRKRGLQAQVVQVSEDATSGPSPSEAHTPLSIPRKRTKLEGSPMFAEPDGGGAYPGWWTFMSKYYEDQLKVIARPVDGFFFGDTKPRRKRPIEPPGFRPPRFKVAIFKSTRLREFDWFVAAEPAPSRHTNVPSSEQSPVPTAGGASILPHDQATQVPLQNSPDSVVPLTPIINYSVPPTEPSYVSPYDPKPSQIPTFEHQPEPSYVSPYIGTNGTKRKRGDSPQPGRGSPPLGPSFSGAVGNDSLSNEVSSLVALKPRNLSSAAIRPVDHSQRDHDEAMDLEIASTLQDTESLEAGSHLLASVSHVALTSQRQSVDTASAITVEHVPTADQQLGIEPPFEVESATATPQPRIPPVTASMPVGLGHGNGDHHISASLTESAIDRTSSFPSGPAETPSGIEQLDQNHVITSTAERPSVVPSQALSIADASVAGQPSTPAETPDAMEQLADNHIVAPTVERSSVEPSHASLTSDVSGAGQPSVSERMHTASPTPTTDARGTKPHGKNSPAWRTRLGGSAAILRRKIIMELVEKCDGVFPSHKEIVLPFAAEWTKRSGQDGMPEAKTILTAVNQLCADNKLQKITFSFQNKHGIITTKTMLTLPNVDITDPRIKETQTQIAAHHPRLYVPPALLPGHPQDTANMKSGRSLADDQTPGEGSVEGVLHPSNPADLNRSQKGLAIIRGNKSMVEARLAALRAQDREETEHPNGLESTAALQSDLDATGNQPNPSGRMLIVPPDSSTQMRPPRKPRPPKTKFPLLRSLRKRRDGPEPPYPLPQEMDGLEDDEDSLTWLPPQYAFTEYNFEEERPTLVKPATDQIREQGSHIFRGVRFLEPRIQRTRRMQEITENAARIERSQAQGKPAKPYLLYPEALVEPFKSPYAPVRPPSPKTKTPRPQQLPYTLPYPDTGSRALPGSDVRQTDAARRESLTSESMTRSSSPDPSGFAEWSVSILDPRNAPMHGSQPMLRRAALVGFMDPIHYFNRLSGTFHVSFSGIEPPRKLLYGGRGRGTAVKPFVHGVQGRDKRPAKRRRIEEDANPFERDVNDVLHFELNTVGLQDIRIPDWPMVNYVLPHPHKTAETEGTDDDTVVGEPRKSRARIGRGILNPGSRNISAAASEALRRIRLQTPMKRRRLTSLTTHYNAGRTAAPLDADPDLRPSKIRRIRGTREETSLGPEGERRLLTAVAVVRTLTGGLEKIVDWVLVAKAFGDMRDQMFIHRKWGHVLQKNKLILPKLEEDFQNMFMVAYEKGTVPPLNFENLASYDWKWLTEWAMEHFGKSIQAQPELPAERKEFDDLYMFDDRFEDDLNEYYETHSLASSVKRANAANRSAFVYPLDSKEQPAQPNVKGQISIARTWVRANVITPEETYDPKAAREKLSTFPDNVIEDALKGLLLDRVFMQENKGRLVPGRNYDINEHFLGRLKRNLTANHFKRALAYKERLDRTLAEQGSAPYSYTADDGDVLAIINMLANKRITLVPINVPAHRWGLTEKGYESRQMDKRKLNFNIEIRQLPAYVEGSPLSPLPPPPCQHLQDARSKIPLWYDVHDQLVPVMWDMARAAVLSLLAVRPGINANVIEQGLRPAMEEWEIEWVLEWLVSAKAASRVGRGYKVDEWWWMALGDGKEVVGNGEGVDKAKERDDMGGERGNSEPSDPRDEAGNVQSE